MAPPTGERVTLFSDFDADGIPAAVLMHDFFKKAGFENFSVASPHRNTEGFGLNDDVITKCIDDDPLLVAATLANYGKTPDLIGPVGVVPLRNLLDGPRGAQES
jgi:single-stranded DNA-specific DHH superfamily exonuclease